jgi:hypothetical protein
MLPKEKAQWKIEAALVGLVVSPVFVTHLEGNSAL